MRVVIVAHGPPTKGGITTVAMDLVEDPALNAAFDVVFVNTTQNDDQRGKFSLSNITRALGDAVATFRAARRGGIVHTHSVQEPWLVAWRQVLIALAARCRGARVLLHNHASAPYTNPTGQWGISTPNQWAFRVLDLLADANILIAETGRDNVASLMGHTALPVVSNSVVVDDIEPSSAVHEPPVILFIGEMLERKGLVTLLGALDLMDAAGVAYELQLVGDNRSGLDPDKDRMVAEIIDRGRGDAMTGPLERAEVYRRLAAADLFVLPTYYEGQPFSVIEALAAGVPIVASDIPAISDMIDDGVHGRLLDMHDIEGFARAMTELLASPDERRRISADNRKLATERYDRSVFRSKIADLYRAYGRVD